METVTDFIFLDSKILQMVSEVAPQKKSYDKLRPHIKKQNGYFTDKGLSSQGYGFSNSHVWM